MSLEDQRTDCVLDNLVYVVLSSGEVVLIFLHRFEYAVNEDFLF